MVSVISKEKKKPYLLLDKYVPVLLTAKYPEYYDQQQHRAEHRGSGLAFFYNNDLKQKSGKHPPVTEWSSHKNRACDFHRTRLKPL